MKRNDLAEFITTVEQMLPVDEWTVNGVYIWPYLRIQLEVQFTREHVQANQTENAGKATGPKRVTILRRLFSSLNYFYKKLLFSNIEADMLFCGGPEHRGDLNGLFINKLLDPITEFTASQTFTVGYLELEVLKDKNYYSNERSKFILDLSRFLPGLAFLVRFSNQKVRMSEYNRFLVELKQKTNDPVILKFFSRENIVNQALTIELYSHFLLRLLKRIKPKVVISMCYYGFSRMALNHAANKLGIVTMDMQHGAQGAMHPAYGNWNKVPPYGYGLMPQYFWCWNEESASVINKWAVKQKFHKAFDGGHTWVKYCENYKETFINKLNESLPSNNRRLILYTMQPIADSLPQFVLSAIEKTGDKYLWLLRLHPRQENVQFIKQQLDERRLKEKAEYQLATSFPLPLILQHTALHLTMFSGAIVESMMFSVPTILMDSRGKELFGHLLDDKLNYYFDRTLHDANFEKSIEEAISAGNDGGNKENNVDRGLQELKKWVK